jgi:membrane protease YdiL (CAAX protease family)
VAIARNLPARGDFARLSGLPAGLGIVGVAAIITIGNGFGEETGWRGYTLPQLQRRFTPLTATLVLAGGWAGWHIPQCFFVVSYKGFTPPMLVMFVLVLSCGAGCPSWRAFAVMLTRRWRHPRRVPLAVGRPDVLVRKGRWTLATGAGGGRQLR